LDSFKLFGLKRKLDIFCPIEEFFELHSSATEGKKDKKWVKKSNFLANRKSLNGFHIKNFVFFGETDEILSPSALEITGLGPA